MQEVETKKYVITGLVDIFDEQGVITGQFPIGSVQELPTSVGDAAVEDGRAEVFTGEEDAADESEADATTNDDDADAEDEDGDDGEGDDDAEDEGDDTDDEDK